MKKKMIIFDIDGTLVDNKDHTIHQSTIDTLKKLKENGHELVIATGRHFPLLFNIEILKPLINHYILINGQQIRCNGKIIYNDIFSLDDLKRLLKGFDEAHIPYGCVSSDGVYVNERNESVDYAYSLFGLEMPEIDKQYYLKEDIYQIWCFGNNDEVNEFKKDYPEFDFISWGKYGFDVLPHGRTKAKSLKILADYLGIDMIDTIAIGDGLNDVEMIKEAGYGIAMGNSSDVLKASADYVTDDVSNDGLYKAFKHLGLID